MKYKMLKTTTGVREGDVYPTEFKKGEIYEIDESLAEQFYHQAAVTEVGANAKANPAEARETKDATPPAYKGEAGEAGINPQTQRIEELNATARDHYGLDTDTTMKPQEIREAIDEASDGNESELPASDAEPLTTENAVVDAASADKSPVETAKKRKK